MGDQFPAGLRVLVVDDDRTCLAILKKMLLSCAYDVTTCGMATLALAMLRENKERFDVVLSDVYMPDMDGFKLLELVGLEMDLPVIMMSADGETSLVMKGITHGACDYLLKPIRIKELKNIWQHVIRKKRNILKDMESGEHDKFRRKSDEGESLPATSSKKRKDVKEDEDEPELDMDDSSTLKKPRVVWSVELHQQFVTAVNQLGIDKAVPKRILELMNVQGLTRENVASHLQKYRLYLKRLSVAQHQNAVTMSMTIGSEQQYNPVDGMQPHPVIAPAASSQALAALRSAYLRTLCSPSDPVSNGMESPLFVVRPRVPPNNQRSLLLSVNEADIAQSQIVSVGQIRAGQDGLLTASSGVCQSSSLAEQLIQQQQEHPQQQQQQQFPHYSQKQGESFVDYSSYKDSSSELSRNFNAGLLGSATTGGISVLISNSISKPNVSGITTGIVKCEDTDPLSGWEAGPGYGGQSHLSWQEQGQEFVQGSSILPYSAAASSDTFDKTGNEMLQRQEYFGIASCPRITDQLGNHSFKVKQEQAYDSVASQYTAGHAQDELVGLSYKQDQESGFFESELGLEGYVPGNLYVK